jgi:hypothetical protein
VFPDGTQIIEEDYNPYAEYSYIDYNFAADSADPDLASSVSETGYPFAAIPRYRIVRPDGRTIARHVVGIVILDDSFSDVKLLPPIPERKVEVEEYDWRSDSYKKVEQIVRPLRSDMSCHVKRVGKHVIRVITTCGPSMDLHYIVWGHPNDAPWPIGGEPGSRVPENWEMNSPRWHIASLHDGYTSGEDAAFSARESDFPMSWYEHYNEGYILPYPYNTYCYEAQAYLFGGPGDYKYDEARSALPSIANDCFSLKSRLYKHRLMDSDIKETLTLHSLSDFRFISVNMLEFTRDLRELRKALKPLVDVWRKPLSPKTWANLWLSLRFGLRLTLKDAETIRLDIVKKVHRRRGELAFQTSRSRKTEELVEADGVTSVARHQKMYFRPSDSHLRSAVEMIYATGFYPTPLAVWELIPYSFVVDWILPVSKYLEYWDRKLEEGLAKYRLLYVLYSTKIAFKPRGFKCNQTVLYQLCGKRYRRWHERSFPGTTQRKSLSLDVKGSWVNIVDSVSLIVQRGKK